jgi:NAD(P)-dependent dehydrogenase (short-subunit alcohol dehydrogenase family)
MEISLKGHSALITGGSKGLGFAMAQMFANSGADVTIVARGQEALDEAVKTIRSTAKTRIIAVAGDVAKPADCQRVYDTAMKEHGKLDILVNNAGESRTGPFQDLTDELLEADLQQKVFAAVRLSRLVLPQMKERKWGRIINVLNTGSKAPGAASAPTAISRAAGLALTKIMSKDGAPHNVLVNALLVGLIDSDQHARGAKKQGIARDQYLLERTKDTPMKRAGTPEEFASLACLLVSDAGGFVSGTAINVDGGASPVL